MVAAPPWSSTPAPDPYLKSVGILSLMETENDGPWPSKRAAGGAYVPAQCWISIRNICIPHPLYYYQALPFVILHITSPSKDEATKAMYDRFMAEDRSPFYFGDRVLGFVVGARLDDDGYVLTVNITDQYACDHFNDLINRRSIQSSAGNAVA
jgi:hypothetical protein